MSTPGLTNSQKKFEAALQKMCPGGSLPMRDIFDDFLFMASTAFRQAVWQLRGQFNEELEASLLTLKKRYAVPNDFSEALAVLIMALEDEGHQDFLGDFYGKIGATNSATGQFFTPYTLSQVCAEMVLDEQTYFKAASEGRRFMMQEPAVGGGSMVIAAAKKLQQIGAQPHTWLCHAVDVDLRCVRMAYIQFTLLDIPAAVHHGNTLSLEMFSAWDTYAFARWPLMTFKPKFPCESVLD